MMYILLTLFNTIYFFIVRNYAFQSVLWIIPALTYFLLSALQYGVGTDYFDYIYIYETSYDMPRFIESNEFLFVYLIGFLQDLNLGGQSVFVSVSLVITMLTFIILFKFKKHFLKVWLVFLLFMTITGMYQNQMNGIRNYVAIFSFVIACIYLYEKKVIFFSLISLFGLFSHFSYILVLPIIILRFINIKVNKLGYIFIISGMIYYFGLPLLIKPIVEMFFPKYLVWVSAETLESSTFVALLPKLVNLPIYIFTFYLLSKKDSERVCDNIIYFFIYIFTVTFWLILLSLHVGVIARVSQYFSFFYIFPIYYTLMYFLNKKQIRMLLFIFVYLITPFIAKTTFLAKNEYNYKSILFSVN